LHLLAGPQDCILENPAGASQTTARPPTTTARVDQRPHMSSRLPHSTDDTHFVAQPRRVTACSVISGPFIPQKGVQDNGGMQGKTSISQAYGRSRLKVCYKKADEVGSRMRPCGAPTLVPLPSSVRANMSRAHAPSYVKSTFSSHMKKRWNRRYPDRIKCSFFSGQLIPAHGK